MRAAPQPTVQIPLPRQPGWISVSRGAALGFACLLTCNLMEILHYGSSSTENWFCSLRPLPDSLARVLLAMAVPSFFLFALRSAVPGPVRNALLLIAALLLAAMARDLQVNFHDLPEADRLRGSARSIAAIAFLLTSGLGLLSNARHHAASYGQMAPLLFAAAVTVFGFPIACIQSASTPRPLPDGTQLCLIITPQARNSTSSTPASLAATSARLLRIAPDTLFLVCRTTAASTPTDDLATELQKELAAASIPSNAISILFKVSDNALFAGLTKHPDLQTSPRRRISILAPAEELARLDLLARRHNLSPLLIPDTATTDAVSPSGTFHQTLRLLQTMVQPASEYLQSLRAPAETQMELSPSSDETVDPQQLMRELQDAAAADP